MKNFKYFIYAILLIFILSIQAFAIMGIKAPGPSVDSGDPTMASKAKESQTVNPTKVTNQPGLWRVYSTANTNGFGVLGPDTATTNIYLKPTEETPAAGDNYIRLGTPVVQSVDGVSSTVIPFTYEALPSGGGSSLSINGTLVTDPNLISTSEITVSNTSGTVSCGVNSITLSKLSAASIITTAEMESADDTVLDDTAVLTAGATYALIAQILGLPNLTIAYPTPNAWVSSNTTSFNGTASDDSSVSLVEWKLETAGTYASATGTSTWSQNGSWGSDGTNKTAYFRATDDEGNQVVKSVKFNLDTINPVVNTVTPSSLTHDGTGVTLTCNIGSITEINELTRQWSLYDVTDGAIQINWATFTGLSISSISIPADQHTYRLDIRCTDLSGRIGSSSSSNIVYTAATSTATYQWNLDDNTTGTTVVAAYGNLTGTLIGATNTSDIHTTALVEGTGAFSLPDNSRINIPASTGLNTVITNGVYTIEMTIKTNTPQSSAPRLICDSSYGIRMNYTSTTTVRVVIGGTNYDYTVGNYSDNANHTIRLVVNVSGETKLRLYESIDSGSYVLRGSSTTLSTPTACGNTVFLFGEVGTNNWSGYADCVKIWNTEVLP